MSNDMRKTFHEELDKVRDGIVRLAAMTTEAIPRATEALLGGDLEACQRLIDADDNIDAYSIELEETIYQLLVLQAPMASDLRALISSLWMINEIERSGDLATNIAKAARRLYSVEIHPVARGLIERMSDEATRLFKLAIDSYVEQEAALAAALDDIDDRLDLLHNEYIQSLFTHLSSHELQPAVQLALIGRYYERIGDHAVNMGERVRYMVTGWMPEHTGQARVQQRLQVTPEGGEPMSGNGDSSLRAVPDPDE